MQLLLDGDPPVIVTLSNRGRDGTRAIEFHHENENGTTTIGIAVIVGPELTAGDYHAIGTAVMAVLS